MSSSYRLKKRYEQSEKEGAWQFGEYYDHYISSGPNAHCHPDFTVHAIGSNTGVKVCVRRETAIQPNAKPKKKPDNGLTRFSPNMYFEDELPAQMNETHRYQNRRVPNEEFLYMADYTKTPILYRGIGEKPSRTPVTPDGNQQIGRGPDPLGLPIWLEYGLQGSLVPPTKFDATQLVQRYPLWRNAMKARGYTDEQLYEMDRRNRTYNSGV
jgi:hypothetical protein